MPELRLGPPSSARIRGSLSEHHQQMLDEAEASISRPFIGVRTHDGLVPSLFSLDRAGATTNEIQKSVTAFLSKLNPHERDQALFGVDSDVWRRWWNIKRFIMRHGLCLEEVAEDQRAAAMSMVSASLSNTGFEAARGVMKINQTISEMTGERKDDHGFDEFGEWLYWISVMGSPSLEEPWGWQIDGHHLNINCFVLGQHLVLTPFFLGSEPLQADIGRYAGTRVLKYEEQGALALVQSFDSSQLEKAVISKTMPRGLFAGAFGDNTELDYQGISYRELSSQQQQCFYELIKVYVDRLPPTHSAIKMQSIGEHSDDTYFAWMGEHSDDSVFYYRIQSPVVLIEFDHEPGAVFDCSQPMRSHAHSILRTPNGNDYGMDFLRQHREQIEHQHSTKQR